MVVDQSAWQAVERSGDRLQETLHAVATGEAREMPTHYVHILGMFWRSVRLYDATRVLLKAELPEEAAIIARSLFEESLRLQQLASDPTGRDALILGWLSESISQKIGLLKTARSTGLDDDVDKELTELDNQRRELQAYQARHHVKALKKFLSERDAALKFGRADDYWTYEWAHEATHGSDAEVLQPEQRHVAPTPANAQ